MKGRGQSGSPPGAPPQRPDGGAGKAQRPEVEAALTLARTAERRADAPEPRVASRGALARAVQILEHTGAHSHAAALRLEYAYSVCGTMQRIGMLREGCARISGDSDEGRALHRALAEALLRQATVMDDGAPRRGLLIEAAAALEIADEADKAGEIYSQLGLLQRAAKAYEQAGAISRLEYTLALLERQEVAQRARAAVEHEIDDALRHGSRRLALELLREHIAGLDLVGPGDHA
ncbi:MAG: hypothetical protein KC636_33895, partial [Myxococcales bacterium]|nr:hypothetical protein [Myxococcales bacterium]